MARRCLSGCSYNKFTTQEEAIKAQWGQVQNQLQRRNDLIPNLVETVKGYAQHEESVYKDIADSRSKLLAAQVARGNDPGGEPADRGTRPAARGRGELSATGANEQFNRLMDELSGTENRSPSSACATTTAPGIQHARAGVPANVTAKVFGFKEYPYFEAPPAAQPRPRWTSER